jgi:CBS domain-containing protein
MFDLPVRQVMERRKTLIAPPTITVAKAAMLMAAKAVGAVMVVEGERLVGIFTERDLAFRVVARGLDVEETTLSQAMTADPCTVAPNRPFGYALTLMHEKGFRHLPVVEDDKPIGIVSARSAMDPALEEFVSEAKRREHFRGDR